MKMKRSLALVLVIMLGTAGAALGGRGDPEKRIVPADQARAKVMLLRRSDFGSAFKTTPPSGAETDFYCKALDESDLTLTGEAESPTFQGGVEFVSSLSQVYESRADSNASWRRGTSAAGETCARDAFRRQFQKDGVRMESFRRIAFPPSAERSVAYRLVAFSQGARVFLDVVVLKQGRAQAALLLGSALTPMPKDVEVQLARVVAGRMKSAMRGA